MSICWVPLMLWNCGVGEDSWESLGLQGDPTSPFWRRSALGVLWKEWCWGWNSSTLATSCEELTHWKRLCAGRDWGQEKGKTEDEIHCASGWGCYCRCTPGGALTPPFFKKKNVFLFGCTRSLLRHMRSLIFIAACGGFKLWYVESSSPTRDQTWALLHWEHGIWATGPSGKPHCYLLYQDHMQLEASGGWQWRLEWRDQESLGNWDRDGILTSLSSAVSSVISWAEDWWTKGRFLKKHGA